MNKKKCYPFHRQSICIIALFAMTAFFTACSKDEMTDDNDTNLPEGQYPVTFTVTGLEAMVNTRAVTITGKDAWAINDPIGISINGGDSKTYNITNASTGAMEPADGQPDYWQRATDSKQISAWYPAVDATNVAIGDQSNDNFSSFDFLVSNGTYNYGNGGSVSLSFKHAMAKVKYTIVKGEGVTDEELNTATVRIYGCTKVTFKGGSVTGNDDGWIVPATTGGTSGEALVAPQQMQGKQFIEVTIGSNIYYYTPANATDANLQSSNQYTYEITVKNSYLEVTMPNGSGAWGNGGTSDIASK